MSADVSLYSSHDISDEELAEVILQAGGIFSPEPEARAFGGVMQGNAYVWITRTPCYNGVFDWDGKPLNEIDIILLDQAKELLGGEFQTWLYIALGRSPGEPAAGCALCLYMLPALALCC